MRICFRIVAIILLETQRTTASQRVLLLRRRYPATDSVSDHPFGLNPFGLNIDPFGLNIDPFGLNIDQ